MVYLMLRQYVCSGVVAILSVLQQTSHWKDYFSKYSNYQTGLYTFLEKIYSLAVVHCMQFDTLPPFINILLVSTTQGEKVALQSIHSQENKLSWPQKQLGLETLPTKVHPPSFHGPICVRNLAIVLVIGMLIYNSWVMSTISSLCYSTVGMIAFESPIPPQSHAT